MPVTCLWQSFHNVYTDPAITLYTSDTCSSFVRYASVMLGGACYLDPINQGKYVPFSPTLTSQRPHLLTSHRALGFNMRILEGHIWSVAGGTLLHKAVHFTPFPASIHLTPVAPSYHNSNSNPTLPNIY